MKFHDVYQKVINVLDSCNTIEQLNVGKVYCWMLLNTYQHENNSFVDNIISYYDLKHKVIRRRMK